MLRCSRSAISALFTPCPIRRKTSNSRSARASSGEGVAYCRAVPTARCDSAPLRRARSAYSDSLCIDQTRIRIRSLYLRDWDKARRNEAAALLNIKEACTTKAKQTEAGQHTVSALACDVGTTAGESSPA